MRKKEFLSLLKKSVAFGLAAVMTVSLAACGSDDDDKDENKDGDSAKSYTYNTYMEASPTCWNPHTWETDADNVFAAYCEMGLVDITMASDGHSYEWVYEMADSIKDVTASFADKEKFGIGADETNRVWEIKLNKNACWEDGTPINADTYIESMKYLLDPAMKNYRANLFYDPSQSESAIANAMGYYNNDKVGKPIYKSPDEMGYATIADTIAAVGDANLLFDLNGFLSDLAGVPVAVTTETGYVHYQDTTEYKGKDKNSYTAKDVYDAYLAPGKDYEVYATSYTMIDSGEKYEEMKWEDVGLIKIDDYTFQYVTTSYISEFNFLVHASSNWLVKSDLYEAGKSEKEGLTTTNYGTSTKTYASYGPYKLVSFEKDKQFVMEKNDKWYGYTDGKHNGQYQTTKLVIDVVPEHATQLQLFLSGQLDEVTLDTDDMEKYRMSDNLYSYDETYTMRWVFATDLEALKALEAEANDGSNKRMLSYHDFRKAISLAMDRDKFCAEATPAYSPAYYLLNYVYYTDIGNDPNSQYRKTEDAMNAVLNLYGIKYGEGEKYATAAEAYAAVSGYDIEEAKSLFQAAYEQAKADGNYTDGQEIKINCMATASSSLSASDIAQQDLLNEMVTAATVGTGFEGKISFTFQCGAENRYDDCASGRIEMIRGAWGGAAFYPFSAIGCYTDPSYAGTIHESCGWDPQVATFDITYDFDGDGTAETVTKTFYDWTQEMNSTYAADIKTRQYLLSCIETAVLGEYRCIPWGSQTVNNLLSKKLSYGTEDYNIMYGFGGVRLMKYNYDDEAWDKYVKDQGGTLDYE